MLTDTALRKLKPNGAVYKVADRDGMYVTVSKTGTITFRYDYRLNGRRETLTLGRYRPGGISLALARERLLDARKAVADGHSPAQEKQREKRRLSRARDFAEFTEVWMEAAGMADSTKSLRKHIIDRGILPAIKNRLLAEITPDDHRALCMKVKKRGAPATAIHVRNIVKQVYAHAIMHGEKVANPADEVMPSSIATFAPKDRALSPAKIRLMVHEMDTIPTSPTNRLGLRMILLTLERKAELLKATWDEVDFETGVWSISKERMKRRFPHNVYLSRQALDILVALKTCAGGSRYLFPARYDGDQCMSMGTLNRVP